MSKPQTIHKLFALQSALINPNLSCGTDASVLMVLVEFQNPTHGYSWPSVELVAAVAGIKERATRASLRRLEVEGYVLTRRGGGRNKTSRYCVRLERFTEAPLRERIRNAVKKRHDGAGFSEPETRHHEAGTRHDDDTKPGAMMPPKPSYGNHLTENPSAVAASNNGSTGHRDEKLPDDSRQAADLRRLDRAIEAARQEGRRFQGDNAVEAYRWLCEAAREYGAGDPIAGWAHRLSEELAELMDDQTFERIAA